MCALLDVQACISQMCLLTAAIYFCFSSPCPACFLHRKDDSCAETCFSLTGLAVRHPTFFSTYDYLYQRAAHCSTHMCHLSLWRRYAVWRRRGCRCFLFVLSVWEIPGGSCSTDSAGHSAVIFVLVPSIWMTLGSMDVAARHFGGCENDIECPFSFWSDFSFDFLRRIILHDWFLCKHFVVNLHYLHRTHRRFWFYF